jgi:hypothetical protein
MRAKVSSLTLLLVLIYDTDIIPLLLSTVRDLFENYHIEHFIIAATLRNEDTFRTFLNGCGKS